MQDQNSAMEIEEMQNCKDLEISFPNDLGEDETNKIESTGIKKKPQSKKNVFEKLVDDALKVCLEKDQELESPSHKMEKILLILDKEVNRKLEFFKLFEIYYEIRDAIEKRKREPENTIDMKDFEKYMASLNEIKEIYGQKLHKRKNGDKTDKNISDDPAENPEEVKNKEPKLKLKNKSSSKLIPGVNQLLNTQEAKENKEKMKSVRKKKQKEDNCSKIADIANENNENIDPSLKTDTAQKNNNINTNSTIQTPKKIPDPKNKTLDNFFVIGQSNVGKNNTILSEGFKIPNQIEEKNELKNIYKNDLINTLAIQQSSYGLKNSTNSKENQENVPKENFNLNNDKEKFLVNSTPNKGNHNIMEFDFQKSAKKNEIIENSINIQEIQQDKNLLHIIKKDNFVYLAPNLEELRRWQPKLNNCTENMLKFYSIKGDEIEYGQYYEDMKNYFVEVGKKHREKFMQNNINDQINKKKIIFIHDSSLQIRKFSEKSSDLITAKNPFKRDDYIIDYDKDSEEEFLEENAEDIKSDENSDEEEKELNDEEEEENKWIVPDGHLSQDEVSQVENLDEINEIKAKNIIDILEFRKNFSKPINIDFRNPHQDYNMAKIRKLNEFLRAKIFNINSQFSNKPYQNDIDQMSNLSGNNMLLEFPIRLCEGVDNKKGAIGLKDHIQDRLPDVCREIHGSLFAKDDIIKNIREKFPFISKASISNFLRQYSERVIMKKFNRKMWYLKENILRQANITEEDAKQIFENNKKAFEIIYLEKKLQGDKLKKLINEAEKENNVLNNSEINTGNSDNLIQTSKKSFIDNSQIKIENFLADVQSAILTTTSINPINLTNFEKQYNHSPLKMNHETNNFEKTPINTKKKNQDEIKEKSKKFTKKAGKIINFNHKIKDNNKDIFVDLDNVQQSNTNIHQKKKNKQEKKPEKIKTNTENLQRRNENKSDDEKLKKIDKQFKETDKIKDKKEKKNKTISKSIEKETKNQRKENSKDEKRDVKISNLKEMGQNNENMKIINNEEEKSQPNENNMSVIKKNQVLNLSSGKEVKKSKNELGSKNTSITSFFPNNPNSKKD